MSADEKLDRPGSPHIGDAKRPGGDKEGVVSALGERVETLETGAVDPAYLAKTQILKDAIAAIGFGRYQRWLFVLVGFGFGADNMLPILTSLIFTPVIQEFRTARGPYLQLGQNLGLLAGAAFWGIGSDVIGRRPAFNITLGIAGLFALLASSSPTFAGVCVYSALYSVGVGGSLPVDTSIFLEATDARHQYLLTILSIFWAFAQLFITAVAWAILGNLSCSSTEAAAAPCTKSNNFGWRALCIVAGGLYIIFWACRFAFPLRESPKYLMGRGRDADAVETVHFIARFNGTTSALRLEHLQAVDAKYGGEKQATTAADAARRSLDRFSLSHLRALFRTRQQAWSTFLLCWIWALIGLAYPLYNAFIPYYLSTVRWPSSVHSRTSKLRHGQRVTDGSGSTSITYRNSMIIAAVGVPAVLIGGALVRVRGLGRRGTLAIATAATGAFILASTSASSSDALLGWDVAYNFFSNIMYAVLYALTPEIFPTKDRGTGQGLVASCNRVFGVFAPVIAIEADLTTSAPIYVAGALFIIAGCLPLLLPYEPRGKAAL